MLAKHINRQQLSSSMLLALYAGASKGDNGRSSLQTIVLREEWKCPSSSVEQSCILLKLEKT